MSAFLLLPLYSLSLPVLDHSGKFKLLCLIMQLQPCQILLHAAQGILANNMLLTSPRRIKFDPSVFQTLW